MASGWIETMPCSALNATQQARFEPAMIWPEFAPSAFAVRRCQASRAFPGSVWQLDPTGQLRERKLRYKAAGSNPFVPPEKLQVRWLRRGRFFSIFPHAGNSFEAKTLK